MSTKTILNAAEVAKHHTEQDCWVIIHDYVWDVTAWLNKHPGGKQLIFQFAGKDATAAYKQKHDWGLVWEMLYEEYMFKGKIINRPRNTPPPENKGSASQETEQQMPDQVKKSVVVPEFSIRMSHGWTVTDGTYDPIPQDKRRKRDVPYPSYVNHTFRTRSALSSLQIARNAPIKAPALDIAFDHLWKCMPGEARRYLHIASPNGPDLWSADDDAKDAMYKTMEKKVYHLPVKPGSNETIYRFFADITKRPWVILPIWVEDEWGCDWIIVVWFSTALPGQEDYFNQLVSYAIVDSRRSPTPDASGRHPPIVQRLERIRYRLYEFWGKAGFNLENVSIMEVFSSPMPLDEATSGERSFVIVKSLVNQIIDWFTSGMEFNPLTTIKSMPQWVNPFQQRVELTGINAWTLMASLDYNARITVEAVLPNTRTEVAADGKKRFIYNYDLAGPYDEPPIASHDYNLPGGKDYKALSGQTKPNTFWEYAYAA